MDGNDVAVFVDLLTGLDADDVVVQMPCGLNGDVGVAAVDFHAQTAGSVGQRAADGAQADDAQTLACDLHTGELALALLNQLLNVGAALDGLDPVDAAHNVTAGQQHAAQSHLHDAVGVGTGGVEDDDALVSAGGQGDVVDACTGTGHGQQALGQLHLVHGCTADQSGLSALQMLGGGILIRPQGSALGGDLIQVMNVIHGRFPTFYNRY